MTKPNLQVIEKVTQENQFRYSISESTKNIIPRIELEPGVFSIEDEPIRTGFKMYMMVYTLTSLGFESLDQSFDKLELKTYTGDILQFPIEDVLKEQYKKYGL